MTDKTNQAAKAMSREYALRVLQQHNQWRRGDEDLEMERPAVIGQAIDVAIAALQPIAQDRLTPEQEREAFEAWYGHTQPQGGNDVSFERQSWGDCFAAYKAGRASIQQPAKAHQIESLIDKSESREDVRAAFADCVKAPVADGLNSLSGLHVKTGETLSVVTSIADGKKMEIISASVNVTLSQPSTDKPVIGGA